MTFYICSCSHMCFWMIDLQLHPKYFFLIHLNQFGNSRAEKLSQCWSVRNCVPLTGGNRHTTTMLKCPVLQHYMFTASNTKTVLPWTIVDWAKIYPISFTWIYLGSELRVAVVCGALSHYLVHYHSYFLSPIFISCLKVKIRGKSSVLKVISHEFSCIFHGQSLHTPSSLSVGILPVFVPVIVLYIIWI